VRKISPDLQFWYVISTKTTGITNNKGTGQFKACTQALSVPEPFQLNRRKNFFTLRVTEPWPRLPREAVESPSLEIIQTHLDKVLCSCSG